LPLLGVDGAPQLALALLELLVLRVQGGHDVRALLLLGLLGLVHLQEQLLDLRMAFLVLLPQAGQLVVGLRELAVEGDDARIGRELRHRLQRLAGLLELRDLLERRLQADATRLRVDEVGGELRDRARDRRRAALGHEQVLALVAAEETVLRLAHALLGGAQALLEPFVGLARGVHPRRDHELGVDVGQGVGPEGCFLRVLVGDVDVDEAALRHRLDADVGHERRAGVPRDRSRLLELQALEHLLPERARAQHAELRVVEVRVLVVAAGQRVLHAQEGRGGRVDLHHHARAVLRRLREGDEEAEAEPEQGGRDQEDPALPEQVAVVAEVDRALGGRRGGERGRGRHV
jgi:hypothetical protein